MVFLPYTKAYTWPRLIGFWLINCQSIGFTLGLVMISSNIGSYSKRAVTSTMGKLRSLRRFDDRAPETDFALAPFLL